MISASGGDLPADTAVVMIYGSGTEEYRLNEAASPLLLFCTPADLDGQPLDTGTAGAASASAGGAGAGGAADAGGAAGAAGQAATGAQGVPALRCTLYTQGPATLEITAEGYPELRQELELQRGKCTVEEKIEIVKGDAGA